MLPRAANGGAAGKADIEGGASSAGGQGGAAMGDGGGSATICNGAKGTNCEDAGFLGCDGFESPNPKAGWFGYICDGGNFNCDPVEQVTVETVARPLCHGESVLHVHTDAMDKLNGYVGKNLKNLPKEFFLRFFLYRPTSTWMFDQSFLLLGRSDESAIQLGFADSPNKMRLNLDGFTVFTAPFQLDQWECIEVEVGEKSLSVYIDEIKAHEQTAVVLPDGADFLHLGLGLINSSPAKASDLYFDEFAMAKTRIGCQRL